MGKIENDIFVCIDCETTGLDPVADRIIEVAVVKFTLNEVFDEFESLINPERDIPATSMEFHHISMDMVQGKPTIVQVLPKILDIVGKYPIVGHSVGFDIQLLIQAAERAGIPQQLKYNQVLDTLRMARLYGESPVNSLEELRKHFNIQPEDVHRAMSDVIVNREVFRHLSKKFRMTEELMDVLSRPIKLKVMPLGKHKGRLIKDLPLDYLLYSANRDFDQDLLFTLRSEINRRKKGGLFTQATNPFAGL